MLILSLGRILGSEFDRPYALSNKLVSEVSNVISIFVYNNGIRGLQFSLTTAVGLFQSVVCVIFLFAANALAKKFGERGIW
jgi:putative aldouronate transport system permease protein